MKLFLDKIRIKTDKVRDTVQLCSEGAVIKGQHFNEMPHPKMIILQSRTHAIYPGVSSESLLSLQPSLIMKRLKLEPVTNTI